MNIEDLRLYALSKPNSDESFPFGDATLVFKTNGKLFLLVSMDSHPLQFNVKCDPERAEELREEHDAVIPGYHMNKKHWNTIIVDGSLNAQFIRLQVDHSYELVAGSKKKSKENAPK